MSDTYLSAAADDGREILTVSELNRRSRRLLELSLGQLWVEGELSGLARPRSGHWYFTLKDSAAQIRCAFFKNRNQSLHKIPAEGTHIRVRGRVSLYEGRGDYQLIVEHLEEAGFGALQQAFEALKAQLAHEGLFDRARKKPLPAWPQRLALITSASGAALHDVRSVLRRRFPLLPVRLFATQVQGREAAAGIAAALAAADASDCDLILLTRGGGSLEDLWPFNEEPVARAIAACRLPVVSAVGHEVDFTIADFVADLRAPTPSAAAELISPDQFELMAQLQGYQRQLTRLMTQQLQLAEHRLARLAGRLRHPGERLNQHAQRLDELELRLQRGLGHRLAEQHGRLQQLQTRLNACAPGPRLAEGRLRLDTQVSRLQRAITGTLERQQQQLALKAQRLHLVSPLATLGRGYALVQQADGTLVQRATQLRPGERIQARLAEGRIWAHVERIETDPGKKAD